MSFPFPLYTTFYSVAVSSNGSIQLASAAKGDEGDPLLIGDGVYLSTNSGATWNQIANTELPTANNYTSVAMSSDGSIQLVGTDFGDGVYLSTNTGTTWTQIANTELPTGNVYYSVAMSSDGSIQLVGTEGDGVYLSTNTGTTWTQIANTELPTGNVYYSVAMSSDGSIQLAATGGNGVYISTNSGTTWTQIANTELPTGNVYYSVAMSSDGSIQLAATNGNGVYLSTNTGTTWTQIDNTELPTEYLYSSVAMSSDGSIQLAATNGNGVYISTNTGTTWNQIDNIKLPTETTYLSLAMSSDGSTQLATTSTSLLFSNGNVYLSTDTGTNWTSVLPITSVPVNSVLPVISGNALLGSTLTSTNGTWSNSPLSYTYQWYRGDNGIDGATSSSYTTVQADIGSAITCRVTATNSVGSSTPATSSNSIIVTLPPQPTPPTPSRFTNLSNVMSITVDSNVEYMYALYVDFTSITYNIAKINANNGTIINRQFVILDSVEEILGQQILVVNNDLYVSKYNNYIYKITNINTTPSSPSIWFTSNMTQAMLIGLATDGTYIYTTDTTNNCIMRVPIESNNTSSNTPWATLTYSPGLMTINNGYMYVTCRNINNYYISKINMSLNPINPENTWVTVGSNVVAVGLAIYGSYMYVAVNYFIGSTTYTAYIGLIYLSNNGEGIIQNLNWVNIPSEFLSSNIIPGIYDVIITQKNQNVNLYTCDDIIQIPLYGSPVPPISNICFPAGTPVNTDQGIIAIEKINPNIHTINKKPIVDIIRTIYNDKYLIGFKKNAISINCPSQFTVMTKNHKIIWQGRKLEAESFLYRYENVVKVKYSGQILYNVLMEEHSEMVINNMVCETLDPNNTVAKLYKRTSKYTANDRYKISKFIAESVNNTKFDKNKTYKNIIKKL